MFSLLFMPDNFAVNLYSIAESHSRKFGSFRNYTVNTFSGNNVNNRFKSRSNIGTF